MQSGEEYEELHTDIIKLLKVICNTKSEYKDVADYPQPPALREIVVMAPGFNDQPEEHERIPLFSEKLLTKSRMDLGIRLQKLLESLESEYKLRIKLEASYASNLKAELQNVKEEISHLKAEMSRLSRKVNR